MIYFRALPEKVNIIADFDDKFNYRLALLRISRQIRSESRALLYRTSTFHIDVRPVSHFFMAKAWLRVVDPDLFSSIPRLNFSARIIPYAYRVVVACFVKIDRDMYDLEIELRRTARCDSDDIIERPAYSQLSKTLGDQLELWVEKTKAPRCREKNIAMIIDILFAPS